MHSCVALRGRLHALNNQILMELHAATYHQTNVASSRKETPRHLTKSHPWCVTHKSVLYDDRGVAATEVVHCFQSDLA